MKKVLIIANDMHGLNLFRIELINKLLLNNHDITISVPLNNNEHPFVGCDVIDTPINRRGMNPIQDFKLLLKYIRIIKKIKPDVVLSYTIKPNLYGGLACCLSRTPYMPNVTGLGSTMNRKGAIVKIICFLYKLVFRKAQAVFVQNEDNLKQLESMNALSDNAVRIPGSGVNLEKYALIDYPPPESPITFNFVARVMKEKGFDEFLEAARYIKKSYSETVFNVFGFVEEPEYDNILRRAHEENVICYHGYKSDMLPWIESCYCTVNPSYHEGMSNVLQESSACGRPVIASDIPGCREIIEDGVTGFLCNVRDSGDLASKLEQFILLPHDKKVRMGLYAHEKMKREFDRKIVVDAYMNKVNKIFEGE